MTRLAPAQTVYLDLLRGLAAQAVLFQHLFHPATAMEAPTLQPGSIGVSIFFFLSGLLIGYSVASKHGQDYRFRDFARDRFFRIYVCFVPALLLSAAVAVMLASRDLLDPASAEHSGLLMFIGNLLMLQDYPVFQMLRRLGLDSPLYIESYAMSGTFWTLPIEFWLYMAFGVIAYTQVLGRDRFYWTLGLLVAISLPVALYHLVTGPGECLTLLWLAGLAASRALTTPGWLAARIAPRHLPLLLAALGGLIAILMVLRLLGSHVPMYELQFMLMLGLLLLVGLWIAGLRERPVTGLAPQAARWLAHLSYPLYVTHLAVLAALLLLPVKAGSGAGFFACNAAALLFWWLFDRHHKALSQRFARRFGRESATRPAPLPAANVEAS